MTACFDCVHRGPRLWVRGDDEEMLPYCFLKRVFEPDEACGEYKPIKENDNGD